MLFSLQLYKGKEVEECELNFKLHRLTADKKLRKVRWSPLSETAKKSDCMFATINIIRIALFYFILFTLFWIEFFQYPDALKKWDGGVYLIWKRIHNKITKPMSVCAIITVSTLQIQWDMQPNPSPNPISSVPLIYFVIFNFSFLIKVSCWRM